MRSRLSNRLGDARGMQIERVVDIQLSSKSHPDFRAHARHRAKAIARRRSELQKLSRVASSINELFIVLCERTATCSGLRCADLLRVLLMLFEPPVLHPCKKDMGSKAVDHFTDPHPYRTASASLSRAAKRADPVRSPVCAQAFCGSESGK